MIICTTPCRRLFVLLTLASFQVVPLAGQGQKPIELPRIGGPVTLDGLSFEPAWNDVEPWIPSQFEPNNGAPPTEKTEFLVAYDDDHLYLALRGYDTDRSGIRANTLYRDALSGDDHFEILIDSFNDNETGFLFTTNPAGHRKDSAISNDASGGGIAGGGWINGSFNTYWDVETTINDEGWFAEMRIPFSSLRFQEESDGTVTMGIALQRKVARKTERLVFPPVRPIASWAFLKPSLAQKITLRGIHPQRPVYVTPYMLGAREGRAVTTDNGDWTNETSYGQDIGLDVKYVVSKNLAVDLTVNTDFAQAEADDQQVNLTRFSLFFPEKRQFFQERSGLFDFRTGGLSRLFHSRRIGLSDTGEPVPLYGGARMVGRVGVWDVGILDMQSAETDNTPSENFGVVRLRRQLFNPYSYGGAMVTSRIGTDGSYNIAYGLDAVVRIMGDDYLTLQWAQTADHEQIDADQYEPFSSARFTAEMTRRRREGFGYDFVVAWAGADYDPGLGFTQRNDFTLLDEDVSYSWLMGPESPLIWHTIGFETAAFVRNTDGTIESAEGGPSWAFGMKSGAGGEIAVTWQYEDLLSDFGLPSGAFVPAGSYHFGNVSATYHLSHTRLASVTPLVSAGTFYDGWRATVQLRPTLRVSKHLELTGSYQFDHIAFPDRDQSFDVHLARLRIQTALNTQFSTNAFIQYNSTIDAFTSNIRFRYNFREGNDLWLVLNHGMNTDRDRDYLSPRLPITDNSTLLVKYTHTFKL